MCWKHSVVVSGGLKAERAVQTEAPSLLALSFFFSKSLFLFRLIQFIMFICVKGQQSALPVAGRCLFCNVWILLWLLWFMCGLQSFSGCQSLRFVSVCFCPLCCWLVHCTVMLNHYHNINHNHKPNVLLWQNSACG